MSKYDEVRDLQAKLAGENGGGFTLDVDFLPTGITSFDHSIGGGFARERISILQGEEHSGKTLIALTAIASVQRMGGVGVFIDGERALTPEFARLLGVDMTKLIVERPKTLDTAYDLIRAYCASGSVDVLAFDSVTSLTTQEELETPAAKSGKRASTPQMHSKELPKLQAVMLNTACIFINQVRENPNPPTWWKGGKMLYSPGGKALRHASSCTVDIKKGAQHKMGDRVLGQKIKTNCVKNKVATPYLTSEFDLMFAHGLDLTTDLIETSLRLGVIEQKGSWFYIDIVDMSDGEVIDRRKYAGRAQLEDALRTDTDLIEHVALRLSILQDGEQDG